MVMRRKIYDKLVEWKNNYNGKYALLIDGARRVGKSYIAEVFAKNNYKSYLLLDFNTVPEEVKQLFVDYLDDLDKFFELISNYYGVDLYERETLFIFDEIQLFPRARTAIKYLVADGRYDYIETGSLMSIKENVESIMIPSEEMHLKMYPLDFEEFLWAIGDEKMMEYIKECYTEKKPLGQLLHRKAMNYFRQYMIIGGMPQAVEKYIETKNYKEVDVAKRAILELYRSDIMKHAKRYSLKVEKIFDEIPTQLKNHDRKFHITSLGKDAKMRDYDDAFMWLYDAMIINPCFNTTEPTVGLSMNSENSTIKCYMSDTGLLLSHTFSAKGLMSEEIYKKLLFDKLSFDGGTIAENMVAQMLVASDNKLYFYVNNSRDSAEDRMEVDFLIQKESVTSRHNIIPIEVKSSKKFSLTSLEKYEKKFRDNVTTPIVLYSGDYKKEGGKEYLPLYMAGLI